MSARRNVSASSIADALQAEDEAVDFFEQVQSATRDPRLKETLQELARQKREHAMSLRDMIKKLDIEIPERRGKPKFYPLAELQKVECYVCGHAADSKSIPESCPRCGASKYAFEKEIGIKKMWEMA